MHAASLGGGDFDEILDADVVVGDFLRTANSYASALCMESPVALSDVYTNDVDVFTVGQWRQRT
jgi:hypothetical protein